MKLLFRVSLFATLVASSLPAHAQTCSTEPGWRAPMTNFCADTAANAVEVNRTLGQIVLWLEQKAGPVGQPFSSDGGVVMTAALADGAVTTAKIAPLNVDGSRLANGAVDSNKLAAGAVTRQKLADGGVPVYAFNGACAGSGGITFDSTCTYVTGSCGTCQFVGVAAFSLCDGTCPTQSGQCNTIPRTCSANNTLRGYLVVP